MVNICKLLANIANKIRFVQLFTPFTQLASASSPSQDTGGFLSSILNK